MRGLEALTIQKIVYLMNQQDYEFGDSILLGHMENKNILIVWEGTVQVRVERRDPNTGYLSSSWLDTLEKGACISVFNCFYNTKSLVNFYASSKKCIILMIKVDDLEQLAKETIVLNDRLNVIKLRIKNKFVDDIDYFTYPKRFLEQNVEVETEE